MGWGGLGWGRTGQGGAGQGGAGRGRAGQGRAGLDMEATNREQVLAIWVLSGFMCVLSVWTCAGNLQLAARQVDANGRHEELSLGHKLLVLVGGTMCVW